MKSGNIGRDVAVDRGWFLGQFMEPDSPFYSKDFEIKWGVHEPGATRGIPKYNKVATTLGILVSGKCVTTVDGVDARLEKPGDFVLWGPGEVHVFRALEKTVVLTVRWPSVANDQVEVPEG